MRPPSALHAALWRVRWRIRVAVRSRPRLVTALLVGVAVAAGLVALRPPGAPSVRVTVAARDLLPGDRLSATDLRTASLPVSAAPRGALPAAALVGRTVAAAVLAGEPLPAVRLVGAGLATTAGRAGLVAVPVRLPDDLASLLAVGDVVDLVAPAPAPVAATELGLTAGAAYPLDAGAGGAAAARGAALVARDARVLAAAKVSRSDGLLSDTGGSDRLLVLAVTGDEAVAVVAASAQGALWPVLRPPRASS